MENKLTQWPDDPPTSTRRLRLVAEAASDYWDLPVEELMAKTRTNAVVWPRSVCMWIARDMGHSYPSIGKWWGKDHGTVIYAEQLVNDLKRTKPAYDKQFRQFVLFYKNRVRRVEKK